MSVAHQSFFRAPASFRTRTHVCECEHVERRGAPRIRTAKTNMSSCSQPFVGVRKTCLYSPRTKRIILTCESYKRTLFCL